MDTRIVELVVAVTAAGCSAATLLPVCVDAFCRFRRRAVGRQRTVDGRTTFIPFVDLARNGLPPLRVPARILLRMPFWKHAAERLLLLTANAGVFGALPQLSELLLGCCLLIGIAFSLLTRQAVWLLLALLAVPLTVGSYSQRKLQQRNARMREQLPDALHSLGFSFLTGSSLQQALAQAGQEAVEPLRSELAQTSDDISSGQSVFEALRAMEQRNQIDELGFLVAALEIQHRTGGSMKELLESAATSVSESIALKRKLQVQTAQARLSFKVVAIMPLVLVALLSVAMEGYLASFFSSPAGLMIFSVALAMELLGLLMIRRILGIEQS
ncbi:MAG: type II secretion system F family protein [Actinomycetia bacterium]|nr:type II secretion system F family protein [Actinomycetes bacterium]